MEMDEGLADLCYRPARSAEAFGTICVSSALVSVRFISADRISYLILVEILFIMPESVSKICSKI